MRPTGSPGSPVRSRGRLGRRRRGVRVRFPVRSTGFGRSRVRACRRRARSVEARPPREAEARRVGCVGSWPKQFTIFVWRRKRLERSSIWTTVEAVEKQGETSGMAVGAPIGAYQESDSGELRALLPLAGRTLIEYQARCVAAAGAAPIVVLVERVPPALHEALERLRADGLPVIPVGDGNEAASRFEAGSLILLVGDGVAAPAELLSQLAEEPEPAVATVPDDEPHAAYERIDASSRWAGGALVDGRTLGATAAMLGDWDLQSTLLRRALQDGALRVRVATSGEPLLADSAEQLGG